MSIKRVTATLTFDVPDDIFAAARALVACEQKFAEVTDALAKLGVSGTLLITDGPAEAEREPEAKPVSTRIRPKSIGPGGSDEFVRGTQPTVEQRVAIANMYPKSFTMSQIQKATNKVGPYLGKQNIRCLAVGMKLRRPASGYGPGIKAMLAKRAAANNGSAHA